MNIGNMRGILGEAVSNEVKTLELRVGQVVRGVVLQQHPNNEATVSINGVQVRAKLEIPLMEGQASLLQVQPDSKGGQIHLKQVDPTSIGLQDPMKDILKALKLPDKEWAHELIKDLRREGFALNKETAAAFQRAAQLQPLGVNQEQWMNAAAAIFKRGLPMTEGTISAMHQLQSGNPLHTLIAQLRGQLQQILGQNNHPQLQQLLTSLSTQLEQGSELLRLLSGSGSSNGQSLQPHNVGGAPSTQAQAFGQGPSTPGQQAIPTLAQQQSIGTLQAAQAQDGATAISNTPAQAGQLGQTGQTQLLPQLLKWLGVNHEALFAKQLMNPSATANNGQSSQQSVQTNAFNMGGLSQTGHLASQIFTNSAATNSQAQTTASNPFAALQTTTVSSTGVQPGVQPAAPQLGQAAQSAAAVATEGSTGAQQTSGGGSQQAATQASSQTLNQSASQASPSQAQQAALASVNSAQSNTTAAVNAPQSASQPSAANALLQQSTQQQATALAQAADPAAPSSGQAMQAIAQVDSVKATIIGLLQSAELPSSIKESAQQLLQAITGQQLMLSIERNHSVFSHITMYVPIQDEGNGQTAAVHVQTRRNRKGELDSDNCRIVFDLQMKHLGPTLVDMNIVNKIVSLNLWNDHPAISPIVESMKPEIAEALQKFGYMLSMVKASAIPIDSKDTVKQEDGKKIATPPDIEQMNSTRYRGVDLKI